jgi:hypothetical protein
MSLRVRACVAIGLVATLTGCPEATTPEDAAVAPDAFSGGDALSGGDAFSAVDAFAEVDAFSAVDAFAEVDAFAGTDASVGDVGAMQCAFVDMLQRTCSSDEDCGFAIHQTDCCGNTLAMGVRASEVARFEALEPSCRASYPDCGCPARPTQTDSGETVTDPTTVQVGCISRGPAGFCMTYVAMRPMDGL